MSLRKVALAGAALLVPGLAFAQPVSGVYVAAGAGLNWLQESDVTGTRNLQTPGASTNGSLEFEMGWGGVISVGYGFGNGLRAEIEGTYRQNEVDSVSGFAGLPRPLRVSGTARTYGVMANALYDFDLGLPVVPYLGVGAGYLWTDYDSVEMRIPNGTSATIDGHDGQFAYQGILGAAFPISAVPGLAITAEYRYTATLDAELDTVARVGSAVAARGSTEVENHNHALFVGVRYAFGAAPPPPVVAPAQPAAAPAPARTFLVFFDFDRADLTDRARSIIAEAATNTQRTGTTRIEVSGHADRSGTPQYNQRLSERRAQAVAAELERRGVPRSAMVIQAFGETRPLVPTADGVREPQNRRVEIVLR